MGSLKRCWKDLGVGVAKQLNMMVLQRQSKRECKLLAEYIQGTNLHDCETGTGIIVLLSIL